MVRYTEDGGKLVCAFEGALNTAACQAVEQELQAKLSAATGPVVFDLNAVPFVASAFLRLCVVAHRKLGAGRFAVANPQPTVKKVFMISGLAALLAP